MNALTQFQMGASELAVILALVRAGNLAAAGQAMGIDASTVFRTVQRAEKALGQRLFERSRTGYRPTEIGQQLAVHAESIEAELEAARSAVLGATGAVSGVVRISTTDTILHGLVLPALESLMVEHPRLRLEVTAGNELANLTRRETDIAIRATQRPPPHLVGRHLGPIRVALFTAERGTGHPEAAVDPRTAPWIAVDEALPEHPSVQWRRRHYPKVTPRLLVNSVHSVLEAIVAGVGVGVVPLFLAKGREDIVALTGPLEECETQLWMLSHPESRHLRRISTVAAHLAKAIELD